MNGRVFRKRFRDRHGKLCSTRTWYLGYYAPGRAREVVESTGTEKKREAIALLAQRRAAAQQGKPTGPIVAKIRWNDLAEGVETDYVVNGRKSLRRLRGSLKHLNDHFAGTFARQITTDAIQSYARKRLDEKAAAGTINRELMTLKRAFNLARRAERIGSVPYVPMLREANVRTGFFERGELETLLPHLPEDIRPVVRVAYLTGWRVASEILTRQWKHVDLGAGWLRLEPGETKNGQGRDFPLIPELRAVFEEQRERTSAAGIVTPWVFHRSGRRIVTFHRSWRSACAAAGVPGRIPHDFRRTAVRNLERAGVPRSAAMAMVGHQTESIYRRYAISDATMLQEAGAKLADFHAAEDTTPRRKVAEIKR